jgi:hypothetical protein
MRTVTINIAPAGAKKTTGYSYAGHMWYVLDDGQGKVDSFGYSPKGVIDSDEGNYLEKSYSRTIEISQEQYQKLHDFGQEDNAKNHGFGPNNYNAAWNSCVDFLWNALNAAGLNPSKDEGDLFPGNNKVVPGIVRLKWRKA